MIQFRNQALRYLQTLFAALAVIMALNLGGALASAGSDPLPQQVGNRSDQTGKSIPIVEIRFQGALLPETETSIPVLLLAEPGRAFVLSAPNQQMQITIENSHGICQQDLLQTDNSGVIEVPIAGTRNCTRPRLVLIH
jgi:hypothetical protein